MTKYFNFSTLKGKAIETINRFTLCLLFIAALTIALCTMIIADDTNAAVIFYLSAATLLSLMFKLWEEERGADKTFRIIETVCHAALIIDAVILNNIPDNDFSWSIVIAQGAVIVAMVLGICFLPFLDRKTDVRSWNFVRRMFFAAFISFLVGGIMSSGISTLLLLANTLFSLNLSYKIYGCIWVIFFLALPLTLLLGLTPAGDDKHDDSTIVKPFLSGVTRYLFIPLLIGYIAVSLFYVLMTLLRWELPNGQVSWLVSAMVAWLIFVEFLLYPVLRGEAKAFEKLTARYAPLLVLPAVILMTIGLIRRFCDYGISINRLYMMTLNLWFYIVTIGLFFTKARRIHWVSLSFGALLLFSSAHPWNFSYITKQLLINAINKAIESNPPKHTPMTADEVCPWLNSFDNKKYADEVFEKIYYVHDNYDPSALRTLLMDKEHIYRAMWENNKDYHKELHINYAYNGKVNIPAGAKSLHMWNRAYESTGISYTGNRKDSLRMSMHDIGTTQNDSIIVVCKISELTKAAKDSSMIVLQSMKGSYTVVPLSLYITSYNKGKQFYVDMNAVVFSK